MFNANSWQRAGNTVIQQTGNNRLIEATARQLTHSRVQGRTTYYNDVSAKQSSEDHGKILNVLFGSPSTSSADLSEVLSEKRSFTAKTTTKQKDLTVGISKKCKKDFHLKPIIRKHFECRASRASIKRRLIQEIFQKNQFYV